MTPILDLIFVTRLVVLVLVVVLVVEEGSRLLLREDFVTLLAVVLQVEDSQ